MSKQGIIYLLRLVVHRILSKLIQYVGVSKPKFLSPFYDMESIILNSVQPNRYHNTLKLNSFDDDVLQPYKIDSVLQFDFSDPSKFANA